jgi:hypothetical protein
MGSVLKVSIYTGSGKSNMAAFKPEISISQLLDEIETKFQRAKLTFSSSTNAMGSVQKA